MFSRANSTIPCRKKSVFGKEKAEKIITTFSFSLSKKKINETAAPKYHFLKSEL